LHVGEFYPIIPLFKIGITNMRTTSTNPNPSTTLPRRLTPLLGREGELAQIKAQLLDPSCRLLTILGAGGMGKTRLAIEVAATLADEFAHDLCFVNLQPLTDPAQLPTALAEALSFPLTGSDPAERQLLRFLANQERLLVLDNFEHLLPSVDFVVEMLAQASGIKLLVTSRELLNIQEEWLFPLAGLAFPPVASTIDSDTLLSYSAVQLFVERVRRVRPQFALQDEAWAVARICQLVEGMPLALELAATWVKSLTCDEVATEIARGLDFLTTNLRNTPERHRSMVVVFQQSWQQLTSVEQPIFARLSVFRGGFDRAAAEQVAGASLPVLMALVDKSLLRWERELSGHGRYQMHELLRQFAEDQLAGDRTVTTVNERHSRYYLHFLAERQADLLGRRQQEAVREIEAELENVRTAWRQACLLTHTQELGATAQSLYLYCALRSHLQEGISMLTQAIQSLDRQPDAPQTVQALLTLLPALAWLAMNCGQLQEAEQAAQRCRLLYQRLAMPPAPGHGSDPLLILAELALVAGDYDKALYLAQEALVNSETPAHPVNRALAYYVLAFTAFAQGDYHQAQQAGQASLTLAKQSQDRFLQVDVIQLLGDVNLALHNLPAARSDLEMAYRLAQESEMPGAMAATLTLLGEVVWRQGEMSEAEHHYRASLTIHERINNQGGGRLGLDGFGECGVAA
jgi:predicted ATPase